MKMKYPLQRFREEIKKGVKGALGVEKEIPIEVPEEERGDYALPCFALTEYVEGSPVEIAERLTDEIKLEHGKAEQTGPYVNFKIDEEYLVKETVGTCHEMEHEFGELEEKKKKIILEHTSANPNGPLHIGRARNPILGDTLARMYRRAGYEVEVQCYINDLGRQIAILTWGMMNLDEDDLPERDRDKVDHRLVRYYQRASEELEEGEIEENIEEMIRKMERGEEEMLERFENHSKEIMEGIRESLKRLDIRFDVLKHESSLMADGSVEDALKRMEDLESSGEEDGALYFESEDEKVFLTRVDGTSLYPLRDIAYHIWKVSRGDGMINVLGEDHKLHGKFLKEALEALGVEPLPESIFYSFVSLEGEKMSTRKGTYVTLDDFMETAHEKAREEVLKRREDFTEEEVERVAEKVGIGAVRFNIINVQPEKPIDFRWDDALDFQGDSAPFVQYAHARTSGILSKWGGGDLSDAQLKKLDGEREISLVRAIARYPLEIEQAVKNNSPHRLARYALDLASEFNNFYRDCPVLKSEDKKLERLALVKACHFTLKSILSTLGIDALDSM